MKKYISALAVTLMTLLTSCDNYIDVLPKGSRIPETLADYEAFMRNEYSANYIKGTHAINLINDCYLASTTCRNAISLTTANYMWKEDADRCALNNSNEDMFDDGYGMLAIMNTIIEGVPGTTGATQEEKNEVMAYAHAVRAFILHYIVNFYADAYDPATAATTPAIPLIYSGGLGAAWHQGTVKEVYDQIMNDFNKAIELGVPEKSMTIIHPSRAAVEAGLARVYLSLRDYDNALIHAEEALKRNDNLYNWQQIYEDNLDNINANNFYQYTIMSPMSHTSVENVWFCSGGSGNPNQMSGDINITTDRASRFEDGDMKFMVRWKYYEDQSGDKYYKNQLRGYYNYGGIATPELYLIKAECQARKDDIKGAMNTLDLVRKNRIHPDKYVASTAADKAEAIEKIRLTKDNELLSTLIPFIDLKRYNAEGIYTRTLTKVFDNKTYTLSPDSHLWTMVYPANAMNRPGNGVLTQNSK